MLSLAAATSSSGGSPISYLIWLVPLIFIGFLFYSQRKRTRAMQEAQSSLTVGQEASTTSGMLGRIVAIQDGVVHLEISPGVVARFTQRAIVPSTMVAGSTPEEDQGSTPQEAPPATASEASAQPTTYPARDSYSDPTADPTAGPSK